MKESSSYGEGKRSYYRFFELLKSFYFEFFGCGKHPLFLIQKDDEKMPFT